MSIVRLLTDEELTDIASRRPADLDVDMLLSHIACLTSRRPADFPKIVCLCGSGRFREAYERAEFDKTLAGEIVLTIGCNTHDIARTPVLEHHKPMLDELHKRKIDLCDYVYVLNVGGYIGDSTRSEIEYAEAHGKPVKYLEAQADAGEENGDGA